jgi:hypothetical protein
MDGSSKVSFGPAGMRPAADPVADVGGSPPGGDVRVGEGVKSSAFMLNPLLYGAGELQHNPLWNPKGGRPEGKAVPPEAPEAPEDRSLSPRHAVFAGRPTWQQSLAATVHGGVSPRLAAAAQVSPVEDVAQSVAVPAAAAPPSLEEVMDSGHRLHADFLAQCEAEFSSENPLFLKREAEFRAQPTAAAAQSIIQDFVRPSAPRQVNLPSSMARSLCELGEALARGGEDARVSATMFDAPRAEIVALTSRDTYERFLKSLPGSA